uniref:Uncharacterized protein n=1 Tax=Arundo donax TaxID=35708 RepID=A0A0A9AL17_ARUDO
MAVRSRAQDAGHLQRGPGLVEIAVDITNCVLFHIAHSTTRDYARTYDTISMTNEVR